MAKNHYVSQLIIRRFADRVDVFNLQSCAIMQRKKSDNIFCSQDIYDDDVEKQMANGIEREFAKLLDEKIINQNASIVLSRPELLLVKKFLLLNSIRTISKTFFVKIMSSFSNSAERYNTFEKMTGESIIDKMVSIKDLKLTPRKLYMRAMRLFLDCNDLRAMETHKAVTKEFYCWAKAFSDSYLNFWDSNADQDFIMTDSGMVSEYEPSHIVFEGLDISKFSYLLHHLSDKSNGELERMYYSQLIQTNQLMYENFNIFTLSATRCMVLCHPFFRLYIEKVVRINREDVKCKSPDIWPSCFETREITKVPENAYFIEGLTTMGDIFTYTPCKLSLLDTIYLNQLELGQAHNYIAFSDIDKVMDSFMVANLMNVLNNGKLYETSGLDALKVFVDTLMNDKYNYIFKHYKKGSDYKSKTETFHYPDHFADMVMRDLRGNKYLLKYLIDNEAKTRQMKNFDFMGDADGRMEVLRNDYKRLCNT